MPGDFFISEDPLIRAFSNLGYSRSTFAFPAFSPDQRDCPQVETIPYHLAMRSERRELVNPHRSQGVGCAKTRSRDTILCGSGHLCISAPASARRPGFCACVSIHQRPSERDISDARLSLHSSSIAASRQGACGLCSMAGTSLWPIPIRPSTSDLRILLRKFPTDHSLSVVPSSSPLKR